MIKFQAGCTTTVGAESREDIIEEGEATEEEFAGKVAHIKTANRVEAGPNIRGLVRPQTRFWWIRKLT